MIAKDTHRLPVAAAASFALVFLWGCSTPAAKEAKFLASGKQFLAKKAYERAVLQFANAAKISPRDPEPLYQLGVAQLAGGHVEQALGAWSRALQIEPNHRPTQLKLAELLATSHRQDLLLEAKKYAGMALKQSPRDPDALSALALAEAGLGDEDDAELQLQKSLDTAPEHANSYLTLALLRLDQGDTSGAQHVLETAATKAGDSPDIWVALGLLSLKQAKPNEAESQFARAIKSNPSFVPAWLGLGEAQLKSGKNSSADQTYRKIAELPDPQLKPMHALFLLRTGRTDEAIREFERLGKDDPKNRSVRNRLVALYSLKGRMPDAIKLIQDALRRNPKDADALLQRAQLEVWRGDFDAAQKSLQEVLHFAPDKASAHFLMSQVHRSHGDARVQRQELASAIDLDHNFLPARIHLSALLLEEKSAKAALEVMDQTPVFQKGTLAAIVQRNWTLVALGNWPELEKGVAAGFGIASVPDLLIQKALLRMQEKDAAGARALVQQVLRSDFEDRRALLALVETYTLENQPQQGVQAIEALVSEHPKSAALLEFLGQMELRNGHRTQARADFAAAKSANSRDLDADLNLARLDIIEGNIDAASASLEHITALQPRNVNALLMLAEAKVTAGKYDDAVRIYGAVLKQDGTNPVALNNIASVLAENLKKPDEALAYAQEAVQGDPENSDAQDTLGSIYLAKGMYPTALQHLLKSRAKHATAINEYHLYQTYLATGDLARSLEHRNLAVRLDPKLMHKPGVDPASGGTSR